MIDRFLAVVWNVDPTFFQIGPLDVRYYGLTWALTFAIGMLFFANFIKREGLPPKTLDSATMFGFFATIIGARLGHCLFYDPGYYLSHPLEILDIRQGGLASHGAAVGLLVGLWLFSRRRKLPYVWSLDRIMVPVTVGGALVRLGNLMNSEIYGVETARPWGFIFVQRGETMPKHPTQIYEALCYLVTFAVLVFLYYRRDEARRRPGVMFGAGLVGVFVSRFMIEYIKNPQEAFEQNMTLLMGQWLSIPFIVAGVAIIVWAYRKKAANAPAGTAKKSAADNIIPQSARKDADGTKIVSHVGKTTRAAVRDKSKKDEQDR